MGCDLSLYQIELKSKDGKEYVEGFISTTDPDHYNDIVSLEAQKSILKQLKDRVIKLDYEHNRHINPETGERNERLLNLNPPGKIIKSEIRETEDGSYGTWVRVELNKNHSRFEEIKNSIKDGFLDGFSIAYDVTKSNPLTYLGKTFRNIIDLIIDNIAFTGDAVNSKTGIKKMALKSMTEKMAEENKIEELSTQLAELKSLNDSLTQEITELKSTDYAAMYNELKSEIAELKACAEKKAEAKDEEEEEDKKKKEIKSASELDSLKTQVSELKSVIEKIRAEPIAGAELKSQKTEQTQSAELADINFKSLI